MRLYVINLRRCLKVAAIPAIIIFALIIAVVLFKDNVIAVTGQNKDLPIYSVDSSDKKVAITFDCAWGANDISDILETLRTEDVKATFFIVGDWAQKFPAAVKSISDAGHDIGNHSDTHPKMGSLDRSGIMRELSRCSSKLKTITGRNIELFRAPYGDYNSLVVDAARSEGYYTIQWDVDSLDWRPGISQDEILSRIMKKVKPGSVILFHNDTDNTAKLLPTIITSLKKEGYSFQPVSKLIMRENYYIDFDGTQKVKT